MRWLFFVLATICMVVVFRTQSLGLAALMLLLTLGFSLAGVLALVSARIDSGSRDHGQMVDAESLRQIREQAEQRRQAEAQAEAQPSPANETGDAA